MKRIIYAVLAVILLAACSVCFADSYGEVYLTGDVNVRDLPNLSGDIMITLKKGTVADYAGYQQADERGVVWYSVYLTDGSVGWVSSKYAELEEYLTGEYRPELPAADEDLHVGLVDVPSDKVFTRDQIEGWYGVIDVNELINVTNVDISSDNSMQTLKISFAEDVYWGGSDGYAKEWLTTDGILTEGMADIDDDGAVELLIIYVDSNYNTEYGYTYIENEYTLAIYEPSGDGYVFADAAEIDPAYMGERFIRYLKCDDANVIVVGNIGYWDGGYGGIDAVMYGYVDGKIWGASIIRASTEDSFIYFGDFEPDQLENVRDACADYEYDAEYANSLGIKEGTNLLRVDATGDLWDYETGKLNTEGFFGIEEVADIALSVCGIEIGYTLERGEYDGYTLYMNGGSDLFWANEGFENGNAFITIKLFGKLDYNGNN